MCLGQLDLVDDPLIVGQKILSCVLRLQQRFGADYTAKVLNGSEEARSEQFRHHELSTWGLLRDEQLRTVRDWIEQLVSQGFLDKVGEYNLLQVTATGRQLLKGQVAPRLLRPAKPAKAAKAGPAAESWEGVDRGLFDELRRLRQERATAQNVPAYVIFHDTALREMARRRPATLEGFRQIPGVGEKKLADYGPAFVARIVAYCTAQQLPMDVVPLAPARREPRRRSASRDPACPRFAPFPCSVKVSAWRRWASDSIGHRPPFAAISSTSCGTKGSPTRPPGSTPRPLGGSRRRPGKSARTACGPSSICSPGRSATNNSPS